MIVLTSIGDYDTLVPGDVDSVAEVKFLSDCAIPALSCCSSATTAPRNPPAMHGSTPSRQTMRSSPSATTTTAIRRVTRSSACRRTTYRSTAPTRWATSRCISREETLWQKQKEKRKRKCSTTARRCAACASRGPGRLYLLWGREDYLREQYLLELKKLCLPGGEDDFSYHRFDGAELDFQALADAVDAVPFLTERTLIEVRGFDTNKCREEEAQALVQVIGDLPDYCTLVFIMDTDFEPDGRLKTTKAFKKQGELIQFTAQGESALVRWVGKRFAAHKKHISPEDARQLIFFTGGLMNSMIPEIDKIAAYVQGDTSRARTFWPWRTGCRRRWPMS